MLRYEQTLAQINPRVLRPRRTWPLTPLGTLFLLPVLLLVVLIGIIALGGC